MSLIALLIRFPSSLIKAGAIVVSFVVSLTILFQSFFKISTSFFISIFVLFNPAVLTIKPISIGSFNSSIITLSFCLSSEEAIFLDMPLVFVELGIKTVYLPANDIYEVNAAPLLPLSSFTT